MNDSVGAPECTMMVNIIDICTERGAFKGNELMAVGTLREKLVVYISELKKDTKKEE